ncbi:MAG TPA: PilZ domain-containing protein [Planctomycetaceae bacterium]|nr:PilZ domain-containing protein [Planctomycetaceae bacterium]
MLDRNYPQRLAELMAGADCRIEPPADWDGVRSRRGAQQTRLDERRRFVRFWFPSECLLEVSGSLPSVPRESEFCRVWTRDIARGGMSVLHSAQLYPGERVRLWLASGRLECVIRRCRRHNARCFELGMEIERITPVGPASAS